MQKCVMQNRVQRAAGGLMTTQEKVRKRCGYSVSATQVQIQG